MKKIIETICPVHQCTGCMACANTCSHSAIHIEEDSLGFKYPKINIDNCINCGLCKVVCPELHPRIFTYPNKCYAAISNDFFQQLSCASGGIATELCKYIIELGGVVVGCSGENINHVRHILIEKECEINKLKGSKYVQSYISLNLFKEIRKELIKGRLVMFIGTGCQVAGLKNYLRKDYLNLLSVDLVCHGVSSQNLLNLDLATYSDIDFKDIRFRRKVKLKKNSGNNGYTIQYGLCIRQKSKSSGNYNHTFVKYYKDAYMGAFLDNLSLRDSCYCCQYAQSKRLGDITLCDFWGLGKDSSLSKSPGPSAILINTDKGNSLFEDIRENLIVEERKVEEAIKGNSHLQSPSLQNPYRKKFIELFTEKGIKKAYCETVYHRIILNHYKVTIKSKLIKIPGIKKLYIIYKNIINPN